MNKMNKEKQIKQIDSIVDYLKEHNEDITSYKYNYIKDTLILEYPHNIVNNSNVIKIKHVSMLHIVKNHTGKMEGINSLSTSPNVNIFCRLCKCRPNNNICSKCYSRRQLKRCKALDIRLKINSYLLSTKLLSIEEIKALDIKEDIFRFEAFGELINDIHLINYFNITNIYKNTTFVLWSKQWIKFKNIQKVGYKKPSNLIFIQSSPLINDKFLKVNFADKRFTCYTKDFIDKNNININCGKKKCVDCKLCYTKNDVVEISEVIK